MADRKNTSKYYHPADFNPSELAKRAFKPEQTQVNLVCPFRSMRCLSCGSYTTKGTKFYNAVKEISAETYLGCQIIRLHTKCPGCKAPIIIETDPKVSDYRLVSGAKRCYEPWRNTQEAEEDIEARLDRLQHADDQDDESTMHNLEHKVEIAKAEMNVADALDEIRAANDRRNTISRSSASIAAVVEGRREKDEEEDAAMAREVFQRAKRKMEYKGTVEEDCNPDLWIVRPSKKLRARGTLLGLRHKA